MQNFCLQILKFFLQLENTSFQIVENSGEI